MSDYWSYSAGFYSVPESDVKRLTKERADLNRYRDALERIADMDDDAPSVYRDVATAALGRLAPL
jgi:hypothetical protein